MSVVGRVVYICHKCKLILETLKTPNPQPTQRREKRHQLCQLSACIMFRLKHKKQTANVKWLQAWVGLGFKYQKGHWGSLPPSLLTKGLQVHPKPGGPRVRLPPLPPHPERWDTLGTSTSHSVIAALPPSFPRLARITCSPIVICRLDCSKRVDGT